MGELVDTPIEELKNIFSKEIDGITDIVELKELFALEIARRDKLILELQKQNELILKSTFKNKQNDLEDK